MLTIPQLHILLEFDGGRLLSDAGSKLGLLQRCYETDWVDWFRATPLGARVINAASRAANEEHGREIARREKEARSATIPKSCLCRGSGWVWACYDCMESPK